MTLSITHSFQSEKSDGSDATLVQPSNWNDDHVVSMSTGNLLGRKTAGSGVAEELSADDVWDFLGFVGTTALPFHQSAAPTGWTKDTTNDNKALRVVSGTVGTGGSKSFTSLFAAGKAVSSHSITQDELPNIDLDLGSLTFSGTTGSTLTDVSLNTNANYQTVGGAGDPSGLGKTHGTLSVSGTIGGMLSLGGSGTAHSHTIDLDVAYVDIIIATKD